MVRDAYAASSFTLVFQRCYIIDADALPVALGLTGRRVRAPAQHNRAENQPAVSRHDDRLEVGIQRHELHFTPTHLPDTLDHVSVVGPARDDDAPLR